MRSLQTSHTPWRTSTGTCRCGAVGEYALALSGEGIAFGGSAEVVVIVNVIVNVIDQSAADVRTRLRERLSQRLRQNQRI